MKYNLFIYIFILEIILCKDTFIIHNPTEHTSKFFTNIKVNVNCNHKDNDIKDLIIGTYNILAEGLGDCGGMPFVPREELNFERRFSIVKEELTKNDLDIILIQEYDQDEAFTKVNFDDKYYYYHMKKNDYPKYTPLMYNNFKLDGTLILLKKDKIKCIIDSGVIEFDNNLFKEFHNTKQKEGKKDKKKDEKTEDDKKIDAIYNSLNEYYYYLTHDNAEISSKLLESMEKYNEYKLEELLNLKRDKKIKEAEAELEKLFPNIKSHEKKLFPALNKLIDVNLEFLTKDNIENYKKYLEGKKLLNSNSYNELLEFINLQKPEKYETIAGKEIIQNKFYYKKDINYESIPFFTENELKVIKQSNAEKTNSLNEEWYYKLNNFFNKMHEYIKLETNIKKSMELFGKIDDGKMGQAMTYVLIDVGMKILIINIHLPSKDKGTEREYQLDALTKFITEMRKKIEGLKVILAGDYNTTRLDSYVKELYVKNENPNMDNIYKDKIKEIKQREGVEFKEDKFKKITEKGDFNIISYSNEFEDGFLNDKTKKYSISDTIYLNYGLIPITTTKKLREISVNSNKKMCFIDAYDGDLSFGFNKKDESDIILHDFNPIEFIKIDNKVIDENPNSQLYRDASDHEMLLAKLIIPENKTETKFKIIKYVPYGDNYAYSNY